MKLVYGSREELGIDCMPMRIRSSKIISMLDEFAESGQEVAEVLYDQKTAKGACSSLHATIKRYKERYANLIAVARRGERSFLIRKKL